MQGTVGKQPTTHDIVSSGRVTAAPTDPHPVLPAPNPGGDGLMVKLAQLGRALFGRN